MSTVTITQTVVRSSYATQEISVEVPEGSTADQIREALLEKAANTVFNFGTTADYQLLSEVGEDAGAKAKADIRWMLDELVERGFPEGDDINADEVVEVMKVIFNDLISDMRDEPYEPHYIYSQQDDLFWSNSDGWVELKGATPFFQYPRSLPALSGDGVRVVTAEQADVISRYWDEPEKSGPGETA